MEWQQLTYFKTVGEMQHFTRAAEKLFISQPTLSRSIAKLEKEIGVPLFERKGRQVILNQYGQIFHKRVTRAIQEIIEGKQEILDLVDPNYGNLSIGFLKSLGSSSFPGFINIFLKEFPNIQFQFYQNPTNIMLEQLEKGEIDFCLSSISETKEQIQWEHLWSEEIFVYVPEKHRLANYETISLDEIAEEKFIAAKTGYSLRTLSDELFKKKGITPKITFEGEEVVTIMGFVAANLGVTLLPKLLGVNIPNVRRLKITDLKCERSIGLAWNKERYLSPVAKRFQQFIFTFFKNP
ncbi:MAG: LysR family transcriptional regulator [Bacillota bacterium]